MAPVDMLTVVVPGAATTVPPHVVVAAGEAATVKPAPMVVSWSVKELIPAAEPNWLLSVNVMVVVPPGASVAGAKALAETLTAGAVVVKAVLTLG